MITPEQCKGARAMLGLSRGEVAKRAHISERTLIDFDRGPRQPYERTIRDVQEALEQAGVVFLPADEGGGVGVRFGG